MPENFSIKMPMRSEAELELFYSTRLQPALEPLEQYRIEKVRKLKSCTYWIIPCFLLIIAGLASMHELLAFLSFFPMAFLAGRTYQTLNTMLRTLTRQFKNQILPQLMDFLFEDYEYIPRQKISKSVVDKSLLFPLRIFSVDGEDFMRFKLGETRIMFCETRLMSNDFYSIFSGIFISASFNKYFKSKTILIPSRFTYFFQKVKQQLFQNLKIIKLEDIEFSKKFIVSGTDQVEARYILTPALMQRLLDYRKKTKKAALFSFVDNHLYCAIPTKKNLFEPALFEPFDLDFIKRNYEPLRLYTDIVDDLNLNVRIWSK